MRGQEATRDRSQSAVQADHDRSLSVHVCSVKNRRLRVGDGRRRQTR